jgi:probable rRNA maturation factor
MIRFENKTKTIIKYQNLSTWLNHITMEEEKKTGDITYVFCDDNFLLKKNQKFLNHETLTDIITFDYSDNKIISGDILISIDRVKDNAKIFKVSFFNELKRVMAHGLLHLIGYNDKTEKEITLMRDKENYYLSKS